MATQAITIDLPEAIVQQLIRLAEITRQPIESLVAQSVVSNLPPMMETASPEMQRELLNLQTLSIEDLLTIANSQIDPTMHQQHVELLSKNQQGTLTAPERGTLMEYQDLCDRLMLRKAYAWSVLRWRGHPIPAIKDLARVG
jgi:hypothetical protein